MCIPYIQFFYTNDARVSTVANHTSQKRETHKTHTNNALQIIENIGNRQKQWLVSVSAELQFSIVDLATIL